MLIPVWSIWLIVAVAFVILEVFTAGFAVMCFSFGAIAAAIVAACGGGLVWQTLAFSILTALAFIFVRPMVIRLFHKNAPEVKTNADALIGRRVRVCEKIDAAVNSGRVALDGDEWKAITQDGSVIEVGETVEIVSRDSIILTVRL